MSLLGLARASHAQIFVDQPEAAVIAPEDVVTGFRYFAADQLTLDDNLYRLPTGYALPQGSPNVARSDHVNGVSLGVLDNWLQDLQSVAVNLRLNHDTFENNSYLSNTSGSGGVLWNWSFAHAWSGQLSANYSRGLVDFSNERLFERDLVDNGGYLASVRYELGPVWALTVQAQHADATHTLAIESAQDSHVTSGAFGIERALAADGTIELQYKFDDATFPASPTVGGTEGNFRDSIIRALFHFEPSDRTTIAANAGYLERTYSDAVFDKFSGSVWHGSVKWQPGGRTQITLLAARDLTAYSSAASEYFVDQGRGINATWDARDTLTVGLQYNHDTQDYIPGADTLATGFERRDRVQSEKVTAAYNPRDWLSVDFYLRWEQRNSNDPAFTYSDRQISLAVRFTL